MMAKKSPNKAVGIDGISALIVMLNANNKSGKIPTIWMTASVVLLPKPRKAPILPSSFRLIKVIWLTWKRLGSILLSIKILNVCSSTAYRTVSHAAVYVCLW
jgi:hypothetical protein